MAVLDFIPGSSDKVDRARDTLTLPAISGAWVSEATDLLTIKAVNNQLLKGVPPIGWGRLRFFTLTLTVRSEPIAVYRDSAVERRAW
jgi:hypothetical protein